DARPNSQCRFGKVWRAAHCHLEMEPALHRTGDPPRSSGERSASPAREWRQWLRRSRQAGVRARCHARILRPGKPCGRPGAKYARFGWRNPSPNFQLDRRGRLSQREHRLLRRSRQRRNSNNIEAVADTYILGIESSCDETAAAVVRSGEQVVSNVVFSQFATHGPYGGVVPELASREHLRAIVPVVRQALEDAHQTYQSVDALAVTQGPGLAGALLVGISYAK